MLELTAVAVLGAAAIAVAVVIARRAGRGWIRELTTSTVVVHLVDGASIRGVLVGTHADALVLAVAEHLGPDSTTPVDGQAVVPRARVAWIQHLPGGEPS